MPYSNQRHLSDPSRTSASLLRLAGAVALLVVGTGVFNLLFYTLIANTTPPDRWPALSQEIQNGTSPRAILIILFSFAFIILALSLALRLFHKRRLSDLLGPRRAALTDFLRVGAAMVVLYAVLALIPAPRGMEPVRHLPLSTWLAFLPPALFFIFIQISSEELVFRGYLQSRLAARFSHPFVWLVLPSLAFGALHYDPATAGKNAAMIALWAALFGLTAADLTARTGTLGAALALHFCNNVAALLFVSPLGMLDGLALYTYPFGMDDTAAVAQWLPVDALTMLCGWLAARLALRR